MSRVLVASFVVLVALLAGGTARAQAARQVEDHEGERLPGDWMRPVTWASVEVNPIAPLAGRWGGQGTVGLVGPLSLVVGVAHVRDPGGDPHYSTYDETYLGSPGVRGTSFEIGPRVHVPLPRVPRAPRFHLYVAPSYLHDTLEQDGDVRCTFAGGRAPTSCATGPRLRAERRGFALDVGAQTTFSFGLYLSAGLGQPWSSISPSLVSHSEGWAVRPPRVALSEHVPRLLFSIGWGI